MNYVVLTNKVRTAVSDAEVNNTLWFIKFGGKEVFEKVATFPAESLQKI